MSTADSGWMSKVLEKIKQVGSVGTTAPTHEHRSPPSLSLERNSSSSSLRKRRTKLAPGVAILDNFADDALTPPGSPQSPSPQSVLTEGKDSALLRKSGGGSFASSTSHSPIPSSGARPHLSSHEAAVMDALRADVIDVTVLRQLCWMGCPDDVRAMCWLHLTGCTRQSDSTLRDRKHAEYRSYVERHYDIADWDALLRCDASGHTVNATASPLVVGSSIHTSMIGPEELGMMKQVRKDVPRSSGGVPFLQHPRMLQLMERVLYLWALRHPACGYVQGMNDLLLPFLFVIFAEKLPHNPRKRVSHLIKCPAAEVQALLSEASIPPSEWLKLEADVFWMLAAMLNSVQENYTKSQEGVYAMVRKLEGLMKTVDPPLHKHLERFQINFRDFSFRWMNCLLVRELSVVQAVRLWDTYLSLEARELSKMHVYVCASFMKTWSPQFLAETTFESLMSRLQNPLAFHLSERQLEEIISKAYQLMLMYDQAHGHVQVPKATV